MAIIYSYPEKTTPAGGDFLVITDSEQPAPNKNRTKSLTVDNLADYVVTSTSGITGSGTLNTIAMFTPNGQAIGDSIITQDSGATSVTVAGSLTAGDTVIKDALTLKDDIISSGNEYTYLKFLGDGVSNNKGYITTQMYDGTVVIGGVPQPGSVFEQNLQVDGYTETIELRANNIIDAFSNNGGTFTGTNVLTVKNIFGQLQWTDSTDIVSGATFLGWARYDGAPSFSNGSEVTVTDGNYIDPPVSLVTNQIIDPYTNGASGKFVFTSDDLNAVYSLTAVFKASAANANQTHVDINFISGATDYERLSKSIAFYKGNDQVDNFHEMFQFYVDSDLITYGLQPRLYAQGGSVKFGDVIFFIQKQQQPAI